MTDTSDNVTLFNSIESPLFQDRCRLRFINAAIAVSTEEIQLFASGGVTNGTVVPVPSTTGLVSGMTVANLTTPGNIGPNITIASVQAGVSVTLSGNVTVTINDLLAFNPAGESHATHLKRLAFAGALFAGGVDLKMLTMAMLANATNRTNCLANASAPGGNILDNDLDFQVNSTFTGIANSRSW
jgi:hypothetical protein